MHRTKAFDERVWRGSSAQQRAVGGEYRTCGAETEVGEEPEYALEEEGLGVGSDILWQPSP